MSVSWRTQHGAALERPLCGGAGDYAGASGTVVFPAAPLKIFLTATAEERAARRHKQLKDKGSAVSLAALSREIAERDQRDSTRAVAPLRPAEDALILDSTGLTVAAVVQRVLDLGRQRSLWP